MYGRKGVLDRPELSTRVKLARGKTLDFDNMVESILLGSGGHFLIDPEEITIDTNSENSLKLNVQYGFSTSPVKLEYRKL